MYNLQNEINDAQPTPMSQSAYCAWISKYLNSKLDRATNCYPFVKEQIVKNCDPLSYLAEMKDGLYYELNHAHNTYNTFTKITHNRFDYIKKDKNGYLIFDFNSINGKYNTDEYFYNVINRIVGELEMNSTISVLNTLNYINLINIESDSLRTKKTKKLIYKLNTLYKTKNGKLRNVFESPLFVLSTFTLIFVISYCKKIHFVYIKADSQQTISLSFLGALTSFLGFLVVFFQLSYENQKKIYSSYVRNIVFTKVWKNLLYIFSINLICSLGTSLYKDDNTIIRDILFNTSNISFLTFFAFLIIGITESIRKSFSLSELKTLIDSIDIESINDSQITYTSENFFETNSHMYESNSLAISVDVIRNNIVNSDNRAITLLLHELTKKYIYHIDQSAKSRYIDLKYGSQIDSLPIIIESFSSIFKSIYITSLNNNNSRALELLLEGYREIIYQMCLIGLPIKYIRQLLKDIHRLAEEATNFNRLETAIQCLELYRKCIMYILYHNTPKEENINYLKSSTFLINKPAVTYSGMVEDDWYLICLLIDDDFSKLINIVTQHGNHINISNKSNIIAEYNPIYNFLTNKLNLLGEEQIKKLLMPICSSIYSLHRGLYIESGNKPFHLSFPMNCYNVMDAIKENREYRALLYNYWNMWITFLIKEGISGFSTGIEIISFIRELNKSNIAKDEIAYYTASTLELFCTGSHMSEETGDYSHVDVLINTKDSLQQLFKDFGSTWATYGAPFLNQAIENLTKTYGDFSR